LRLTEPDQAPPEVVDIYSQLKSALGVPFIGSLYRAYGTCPAFLALNWKTLEPVLRSRQFFSCADRLRAFAYTQVHSYLGVPDLCEELSVACVSEASRKEISDCVALFHRSSAYFLLMCAWQLRAFEGPVGKRMEDAEKTTPPDMGALPMLMKEEVMPPATKKVLEEIRRATEAPTQHLFYVAIARWPDLLTDFWRGVQPEISSPLYENSKRAIMECANQLCDELPGPLELTTVHLVETMRETDIGSLVRITESFNRSLGALVLNVAWARIGLEGGTTRLRKKVRSVEDEEPRRAVS
jgi:hypothetical protein